MDTTLLTEGTDLLALEPDAGRFVRPPRLSGRLRRRGTLVTDRWSVPVRFARHDGLFHLVSDTPVAFEPGEGGRLDGQPLSLLVALDALDPSRRRRVARLLVDTRWNDATDLAQRIARSLSGGRRALDQASPAARSLLDEFRRLEQEDPQALHVQAMQSSGRAPIVRELVERGEVVELEGGYLLELDAYEARARSLPGTFSSIAAARRWGCSHGRARAILDRMVVDGRVHRHGGTYVVAEDGGA